VTSVLSRLVTFELGGRKRRASLHEALTALSAADKERAIARLMARLPKSQRFRLFVELANNRERRGLRAGLVYEGSLGFEKPDRESARLAPRAAAGLIARHGPSVPTSLRWPVFAALLRSGAAIDPKWDVLLPVAFHDRDDAQCKKLVPLMLEAVQAIPEARRDAAVIRALKAEHHSVIRNGRRILAVWPSARLVAFLLEQSKTPRQLATQLSEEHPALAPVIKAVLGGKQPLMLRRASRSIGRRTRLTPLERQQLVVTGQRWDGQRLEASTRLGGSVDDALLSLERHDLSDDTGAVRFVAFTHSGDSGAVFAAGTRRVVASIVQSSVECSNARLREALELALAASAEKPG